MKRRLFIKSSGSAAAAVVLTACGGGGGSAVDASPADTASATAAAVPQPGPLASAQGAGPAPESTVPASTSAPAPAPSAAPAAGPFNLGVNIHTGGSSISQNAQIAAILQARNFKRIRMDYFHDLDQTLPRDLITKIRAYGGSVEVSLQISYQWDYTVYTDLAAVQAKAYREAYAAVDAMKDVVHDFELLNEVQLRPEIQAAVPWNTAGTSKTPYQNKPAMANLAAILRGMANAIHDVGAKSALPLRVVMGVIGRDFGLLSYLRDEGVQWDVTGYHVYPHERAADLRTDTWYGPGGPLAQLGAFGKPVTLNEFNAAEIYDAGYENASGQSLTESGLRVDRPPHAGAVQPGRVPTRKRRLLRIAGRESKPAPENRFGLMFNLDAPKDSLYLVTALAGGTLSSAERTAITSRGLLTDGQIDAMRR